MKKLAVLFVAVGLVFAVSGRSMAADSATIDVQAVVLGTCVITVAPGLQSFTPIDIGTFAGETISTAVNFQCTSGIGYTVTLNGVLDPGVGANVGPNLLTDAVSLDTIPYDIVAQSVGNGFGGGAVDIVYDMDMTILPASVTAALSAGTYDGSFVFAINP